MMHKPKFWILAGVLIVMLVWALREHGHIDFTLYKSWSHSQVKWESSKFEPFAKLDIVEVQARDVWAKAPVPGSPNLTIYYSVVIQRPLARWMPLLKFGDTEISKRFVVISPMGKVASGSASSRISCTAVGLLSARGYSELVEQSDLDAYLKSVAKSLAK